MLKCFKVDSSKSTFKNSQLHFFLESSFRDSENVILCCGPADSPQGASFLKSLPWKNLGRKQESSLSWPVQGTGTCVGG